MLLGGPHSCSDPIPAVRRPTASRWHERCSQTGSSAAFAALNYVVYERTLFGRVAVRDVAAHFRDGRPGRSDRRVRSPTRFDRRRVMIVSDLSAAALHLATQLHEPVCTRQALFVDPSLEPPRGRRLGTASRRARRLFASMALVDAVGPWWRSRSGFLLGPLLGGALLAAKGARPVFVANSLSFVLSALLCVSISGRFRATPHAEHGGLAAGMRLMARDRLLRGVGVVTLGTVLGFGMTMVATVPLARALDAGPSGYSALIAGWVRVRSWEPWPAVVSTLGPRLPASSPAPRWWPCQRSLLVSFPSCGGSPAPCC
jgi:hypothetical protein